MIRIDDALVADIRDHAEETYPLECCGALIGDRDGDHVQVVGILPLENRRVGDEARRRFFVTASDFLEMERDARSRGMEILGFYHSHPDHAAQPSEYDREHALPWYVYVIVSVENGRATQMTGWSLADDRSTFDSRSIRSKSSA